MGGISIVNNAGSSLHEIHYKSNIFNHLHNAHSMIANNVLYYLIDALFTNYRNKIWNFLLGFGYGSKWGNYFINYVS